MTVRSLGSWWKHSPLSIPQMVPSGAEDAVADLPVGVVGHHVEGADHPQAVVVAFVLDQGEVVLGEVGVDESLERSLAEGGVEPGRSSRG